MSDRIEFFELVVCPTAGCFISAAMFSAPINDLRQALLRTSLGSLNPFPWVVMSGNCLGWLIYGYYTRDPFVIASNLPGFILSFWLNMGAAKLQYIELCQEMLQERYEQLTMDHQPDGPVLFSKSEGMVVAPQEASFFSIIIVWCIILIWTSWFYDTDPAIPIGILVNFNLIFLYGAPLNMMRTVIEKRNSDTIHRGTMIMNSVNSGFWIVYGLARQDPVIIAPNAVGLALQIAQGGLCLYYPRKPVPEENGAVDTNPLLPERQGTDQA